MEPLVVFGTWKLSLVEEEEMTVALTPLRLTDA
jgi:hypothetical protein